MVYRTRYPEGEELERMLVEAGQGQLRRARLILVGIFVLGLVIFREVLDFPKEMLWVTAGIFTVVLVAVELMWRSALRRHARLQVPVFGGRETLVTVEDGGLMLETPATRSSVYYPWPLVSRAQLYRRDTMLGFQTPTRMLVLAMHGLEAEQRTELLRELQQRAGKEGGALLPPPLDAAAAHPLELTRAQRSEAADMTAVRSTSLWVVLIRCAVLAFFGWYAGNVFSYGELGMDSAMCVQLVVLAFGLWIPFIYLLHPGRVLLRAGSTPKAQRSRCRSYLFDTEGQRLLALRGEGSWAVTGLDQVETVGRGKTCRVLFTRGQASGITLPPDAELPSTLPAEQPLPRRSRLFIPALVLAAALFAAAYLPSITEAAPEEEEPTPEEMYGEVAAPIMG